jgi:acyl carrier protein
MSDTMERVKKITAQVLKIDPARIGDTANFVKNLGAESIQSIELVAAFEEEFDIEMDEDAALSVQTIDTAAEFIDKVMAEQHS